MDIECSAFDGQVTGLNGRRTLIRVGNILVQVVEIDDVISFHPTAKLDAFQRIDFCDVPEVFGRAVGIDAIHLLSSSDEGEGDHPNANDERECNSFCVRHLRNAPVISARPYKTAYSEVNARSWPCGSTVSSQGTRCCRRSPVSRLVQLKSAVFVFERRGRSPLNAFFGHHRRMESCLPVPGAVYAFA